MGEEIKYPVNDTNRAIGAIIEDLDNNTEADFDPRVKAILKTKLEEAQLWSLKLIRQDYNCA
jgi:hypothetical protein